LHWQNFAVAHILKQDLRIADDDGIGDVLLVSLDPAVYDAVLCSIDLRCLASTSLGMGCCRFTGFKPWS